MTDCSGYIDIGMGSVNGLCVANATLVVQSHYNPETDVIVLFALDRDIITLFVDLPFMHFFSIRHF